MEYNFSNYLMLLSITKKYLSISEQLQKVKNSYITKLIYVCTSLPNYYKINDLMWQDGLIIDFLQKKVVDKWMRRFLVCSSYIFSERTLFQFVVRFYIDSVVWPFTWGSLYEASNVAYLLSLTVAFITLLIVAVNLNYLFLTIL